MATPTLIGMPDPPSAPDTPTEAPGTPNSTATSLSALSTIAIKDGHRGASFPHDRGHHHTPSTNTLEAERADRISRLAGLERVSTVRPLNSNQAGGTAAGPVNQGQIPGYFDQNGNPVYTTKMSTVGSASATGSVGGRTTTWASGSQRGDDDVSMDTNFRDIDERDRYSASMGGGDQDADMEGDGMSDDASLVGFGEGAGSTVSGPIYTRRGPGDAMSPVLGRSGSALASQVQSGGSTPGVERERRDARMIDGLADDGPGYTDTARASRGPGVEAAERIMRERLENTGGNRPMGSPDEAGLGKFYFEEKK